MCRFSDVGLIFQHFKQEGLSSSLSGESKGQSNGNWGHVGFVLASKTELGNPSTQDQDPQLTLYYKSYSLNS